MYRVRRRIMQNGKRTGFEVIDASGKIMCYSNNKIKTMI